ncbi:SRPBCC family protein [Streptomyces sp. MS06]|uniref:SRPBCC family protein n=1 Tax=Streptomyces sp. MS06 TaxID=3385974 RepID=UPI0039A2060F
MEHEVFVPVPGERLRMVLADPARVARAVPGLQQDAGTGPVAGRLKMRIGSHSITYRGTLRFTARADGTFAAAGDAVESRGTGKVEPVLTVRVADAEGGARLTFDGSATASGRVTEMPADAVRTAVIRLLTRFAERLAAQAETERPLPEAPELLSGGEFEPAATSDFETAPDAEDAAAPPPAPDAHAGGAAPAPGGEAPGGEADSGAAGEAQSGGTDEAQSGGSDEAGDGAAGSRSVFETEVPPPSLDPLADEDESPGSAEGSEERPEERPEQGESPAGERRHEESEGPAGRSVAEAAHARRTMIGRSAEEVDHAPPRGRYAPVPPPQHVTPGSALRWAAPAAAVALASAIVVGRALRKRR